MLLLKKIKMLVYSNSIKYYSINAIEKALKRISNIIELHSRTKISLGLIFEKEEYLNKRSEKILVKISEYKTHNNNKRKRS